MLYLIPKNVTSERPIALMPTLIRWWEALWWRSDRRSTALIGTLLMAEVEELSSQSGKFCWRWRVSNTEQGKTNWEQWLWCWTWQKAFERVSLPVVWAWATHLSFQERKILWVQCRKFEHQRRVQFERCAVEPLRTITAILPESKWSCLLLAFCVARCAE